jgi:hypothetical protein
MNKGYAHMELEPLRMAISAIPGVTGKERKQQGCYW